MRGRIERTCVHEVVGPLADRPGAEALYVEGARFTGEVRTATGVRRGIVVPAFGAASFGTYFNAFPAAHWRHWTPATSVRLRIVLDAAASLVVRASDAAGTARSVGVAAPDPGEAAEIDVDLAPFDDGGLVWFEIHAGADDVRVVEGGWSVDAPVSTPGDLLLGMPTVDRAPFVAANLRRLAEASALTAIVRELVVVDQGASPVADDPEVAAAAADSPVRIVRQANLGGSGGFSRVMAEAADAGTAFVTLLDDDIAIEPASLTRLFEFGRRTTRPTIVGAQMLDLGTPTVLHAGAESVDRRRFWWGPTAPEHARPDLAAQPLTEVGWLHRRLDSDFVGWWTAQIPVSVIDRLGLALPLFLKWDDAEYGLRAAGASVPSVSLPGAAVWHVSWADKDDMLEWPAYFHARNRLIAALLHGEGAAAVLAESRQLDLKQLLSMQYTTVALRHRAMEAVLLGPDALTRAAPDAASIRASVAGAADLTRHPAEAVPPGPDAAPGRLSPAAQPTGARFAAWTAATVARHALAPVRSGREARLSPDRRRWWVLPAYDRVFAPTADRRAYFRYTRDRARFRAELMESVALHRRLAAAWPRLAAEFRAAAPSLASPSTWSERFGA